MERNLKLADMLNDIGYPHNVTAGVVAIAWTLSNPAVTGAIVGGRSSYQVNDNLPAAEFRLRPSELADINKFLEKNP